MDFNKDLDPPPPQDISNVFAAADLLSHPSYDSAKDNCAWLKAKVIRSSILSAWDFPDACIRALSITLNNGEIAYIIAVNGVIFPKKMLMQLPDMNK